MKSITRLLASVFLVAVGAVTAASHTTEGEVRKIDKDSQKITLRHGPIKNLDMPAMTMVFRVRDPALLGAVKTGDKVRFVAEHVDGSYFLTSLEAVP